jgi:CRP/FNR family cyclic AMP-dependent transcriptional regulator
MTRQTELFTGLSDADVAALTAVASRITLEAGGVLFRIGNEATNLYLIEDGQIELTMPIQVAGREEDVRIEERRTGQTLGWSTLVPPHRFTLNAQAPVTTGLLAFPRESLLDYFAARPDVGYVVLRNVAAIVGQRLQVFQAMWLRQMQHMVNLTNV